MGLKPQGFKGGEVKEVSKVNASLLLLCLLSLNYLDRVFNAIVIKVQPPGKLQIFGCICYNFGARRAAKHEGVV